MGKGKKVAIGLGVVAGVVTAIVLATRKAEAAPPPPPPPPPPGLANLYGIVADTNTGQPIQGASVILGAASTSTDSSGRYIFNNVEPGSYQMTFSKNGYETGGTMITLHEGQNELNVQLIPVYVPPPTGNLYGVVTDAATGAPLQGVKVTLGTAVTYTDANGAYAFALIPPGSYSLTLEKAGYVTQIR